MSKPRLQLGFVKQLVTQLITNLTNEQNSNDPLSSLNKIATSLKVNENEFKPLLNAIKEKAKKIPESEQNILTSKFKIILTKITKKLERDFK